MRLRPYMMAEGLTAWARGEDSVDGDAASELFSEFVLRALAYLRGLEEQARARRG